MMELGALLPSWHGYHRQLLANGLKIPNKGTVCAIRGIAEPILSKNRPRLDPLSMIGGEFRLHLRHPAFHLVSEALWSDRTQLAGLGWQETVTADGTCTISARTAS